MWRKKALRHRVPAEILKRKKAGFPVPYARWLRTDMKDWLRDILLDGRTLGRGYFRKEGIEHLISTDAASGGYSKELFSLAVLELWHRAFLDSPTSHPNGPTIESGSQRRVRREAGETNARNRKFSERYFAARTGHCCQRAMVDIVDRHRSVPGNCRGPVPDPESLYIRGHSPCSPAAGPGSLRHPHYRNEYRGCAPGDDAGRSFACPVARIDR